MISWDIRSNSNIPIMSLSFLFVFRLSRTYDICWLQCQGSKGIEGAGGEIKVFDLRRSASPVFEGRGHRHDVISCRFSSTSKTLISAVSKTRASCCGVVLKYCLLTRRHALSHTPSGRTRTISTTCMTPFQCSVDSSLLFVRE
jgi:hypothetical protein